MVTNGDAPMRYSFCMRVTIWPRPPIFSPPRAPAGVQTWQRRYEDFGEAGLAPEQRGRPTETVTEALCATVLGLIQVPPGDDGYLRSRWTSEMLAEQLYKTESIPIHASTVRRLLPRPRLGVVWNPARPTLCIQDRTKAHKMKAIKKRWTRPVKFIPFFMLMKWISVLTPVSAMVG